LAVSAPIQIDSGRFCPNFPVLAFFRQSQTAHLLERALLLGFVRIKAGPLSSAARDLWLASSWRRHEGAGIILGTPGSRNWGPARSMHRSGSAALNGIAALPL